MFSAWAAIRANLAGADAAAIPAIPARARAFGKSPGSRQRYVLRTVGVACGLRNRNSDEGLCLPSRIRHGLDDALRATMGQRLLLI